ncbi:hypothetical protein M758_UG157800 [Ceratodon purpureus]|nr:hypothetical protein M758_UG157800 [Ceratodon purpureus]
MRPLSQTIHNHHDLGAAKSNDLSSTRRTTRAPKGLLKQMKRRSESNITMKELAELIHIHSMQRHGVGQRDRCCKDSEGEPVDVRWLTIRNYDNLQPPKTIGSTAFT